MAEFPAALPALVVTASMTVLAVVCYALAVSFDHVASMWPFISDLGVFYPESCVTSLLSSVAAIAGFPMAFIRYKHIVYYETKENGKHRNFILKAARISLIFMCLAMVGTILNGSFQRFREDYLHSIGGGFLFLFGWLFCMLDSFITFHMSVEARKDVFKIVRILISAIIVVAGVTSFVCKIISESRFMAAYPQLTKQQASVMILHWNDSYPAYGIHLASTFSELIVLFFYLTYISTFAYELKGIEVDLILIPK